eukprot:SAG22_NODE_705_length_7772_cov_45.048742_4_plen_98_part_00
MLVDELKALLTNLMVSKPPSVAMVADEQLNLALEDGLQLAYLITGHWDMVGGSAAPLGDMGDMVGGSAAPLGSNSRGQKVRLTPIFDFTLMSTMTTF